MKKHPSHYAGQLTPVKEPTTIEGRYKPYELDSTFSHILCHCGSDLFEVFLSDYPEVMCMCASCERAYLLYDASCYPASTEYEPGLEPEKGDYNQWVSECGTALFHLIVNWLYPEYPDHQDDIDWFVLITIDPDTNEYTEIISNETL